jgi:AcrR family transcriptional regulator
MEVSQEQKRRLTGDDWAKEALTVLAERGLGAVAVEPIALRLGATKGSFYWHFANRDALVEAALERWEREYTEMVIAGIEAEPDPRARLRRLFAQVVRGGTRDRVEVTLLGSIDDPRVRPVLERVTERRVDYVTQILAAAGLPAREARQRAVLAYTAYLGHVQLAHLAPATLPGDRDYLDLVVDSVMG